jgi:hypothetical protein
VGLRGGTNLYAYVKNNPIKLIDPEGNLSLVGGGMGAEVHAVIGFGSDTFWCCDGEKFWRVGTVKVCLRAALGYSGGVTVQVIAAGVNPRDKCPGGYAGFAPEFGYGPVEYGAGLPDRSDGVLHSGGIGRGAGGKATLCHYWIYDQQEIGRCGKAKGRN